jgi:hypothetical protein
LISAPSDRLSANFLVCISNDVDQSTFDISQRFFQNDFDFFRQFQNVGIRYVENLHAKYYANEHKSIITSLNLHSFSINNNIEVGVLFEQKFGAGALNLISERLAQESNVDYEAFEYFEKVINKSTQHFNKKVKIKSTLFGLIRKKVGNVIETDNSSTIYKSSTNTKKGYCIRTGTPIPFNLKQPYSKEAFESWSKWKNKDYKEKYCHYSGEVSNGETSFAKPVLGKHYKVAIKK